MTTPNFTSLLTALRAFVLKSRPAYKDYLGIESVEEKTVLLTGTLSATGESVTAADGFTGFTNGQTYKATIGGETVEVTAQYGTGSFSECIVIGSSNAAPSDTVPGWMVCVYNGNLLGFGTGDWAGKQIEVATSKMVPTEKWDVKKLPKECLPEKMPENWAEELDVSDYKIIPVTVTETDGEYTATSDYAYEQVKALIDEGKNVVVHIDDGKSEYYASLVIDNGSYLLFSTYHAESQEMLILAWSEDAIQFLIDPILTEDHLSNDEPLPAGTAAPGTSRLVSRADHVHSKELPDGATANQQLVTDSDGNTQWEDRPGGYSQKSVGDYTYERGSNTYQLSNQTYFISHFADFCSQNEYKVGDTITVVCNGVTYEDVSITGAGYYGETTPVLEITDILSLGKPIYTGSWTWELPKDVFPDGTTSVTFKDAHLVVDVQIAEKYIPDSIDKELSLGKINVDNITVLNALNSGISFSSTDRSAKLSFVDGTWIRFHNGDARLDFSNNGELKLSYPVNASNPTNVLIKGVRTPVDDTDAANKAYVDSTVKQATEALGTDHIILSSSTADSTKKFKITVDDTGTLTATEVTTTT